MKNSWLNGKTVIITGASGGIGFNVSKILIEKYDCKIIGIARNEEKILSSVQSLKDKKNNFFYLLFDVSKKENWKILTDYLDKNAIIPDVLINNAGFMLPFSKFEKYSDKEIEEIINTNFVSDVISVKTLLPYLKKSKTPSIINVSSSAGLTVVVGESMYCATKFAVRGFTESLIQEYKKQIYIAGVYPGFIKTDILNRMSVKDKENKLINKLMMPVEKASKKIVNGIKKKKTHIGLGIDGKSMAFFGRIFPNLTPTLITKTLKKSKLELFDGVFEFSKK